MAAIIRHAILSPSANSWNLWTSDGHQVITNPGASHRSLESLTYAIDRLAEQGWSVAHISVEQGNPNFVLLARQEQTAE
jgi:hypothetical protein